MGLSQSKQCTPCIVCTPCSCPTCPTQTIFPCDTNLLEKNYHESRKNAISMFNGTQTEKTGVVEGLEHDIEDLENHQKNNNAIIQSLIGSIEQTQTVGDYVSGKDVCINEQVQAVERAEACKTNQKHPALTARNTTCQLVRSAVEKTYGLNGEGWAQCQCPNGVLKNDHLSCAEGQTSCASCNDGFWKKTHDTFESCEPLKECELGVTYETTPPTLTSNRECSPVRTCQNGQYEIEAPTLTSNRVCQTKQCTCENGTPTQGIYCPANGEEDCSKCNNDSQLVDSKCVYKQCRCPHGGTAAEGAACGSHNLIQCASCNSGYNLTDYNHCVFDCVDPEKCKSEWYGDDSASTRDKKINRDCRAKGLSYEGAYESRDDPDDNSWFFKKQQYRGECEHKIWSRCYTGTEEERDAKIKAECEQKGVTFVPGESDWESCGWGRGFKGNCLPPVWTSCYSDRSISGDISCGIGERDECFKRDCERLNLSYTQGSSDWAVCPGTFGGFKGRCT